MLQLLDAAQTEPGAPATLAAVIAGGVFHSVHNVELMRERERERGFQTCPPPVPEGLGGLRELRHSSVLRALNVAKQLGS